MASSTNNEATVLGVSTVDGNLAVTDSTGNLTQTAGILTVTGTSSFTTSGTNATITLGSANLLAGAVSLNTSGTTGNAIDLNNKATVLGALDGRWQSGGDLDLTGNLTTNGRDPDGHRDVVVHDIGDQRDDHAGLGQSAGRGGVAEHQWHDRQCEPFDQQGDGARCLDGRWQLAVTDTDRGQPDKQPNGRDPTVTGTSSFTNIGDQRDDHAGPGEQSAWPGTVSLNTSGTTGNASLTNNEATVLGTSNVGGTPTVNSASGIFPLVACTHDRRRYLDRRRQLPLRLVGV